MVIRQFILVAIFLLTSISSWAQSGQPSVPLPSALRDPAERLMREQQERERTPTLVPPLLQSLPNERDSNKNNKFPSEIQSDGPAFVIEQIEGDGDLLISQTKFLEIASVFKGKALAAAHIQVLLDRITQALVEAGYITSRATLDAQNIAQGHLKIAVFPGRIESIRYNGRDINNTNSREDSWLTHLGVRFALPMQTGDVLKLQDIEQAVDQINRLRRNAVQVQVVPGDTLGGSIVEFNNNAGLARAYSASIDNQGSSTTGLARIQGSVEQSNALGLMESLTLGVVTSTETNAVFGSLSIPWGYYTFNVIRSWSEYQNLIADTALVYGTSQSTSFSVNRLLTRSQNAKLIGDISITHRRSAREINNLRLTPQQQTVIRGGINRLSRFELDTGMGQWTFDIGVVRGIAGWGADRDAPDLPEGTARAQFTKMEANTSLLLPLGKAAEGRWLWRSRFAAQISRSSLYSSEQLFAGGVNSVRGFPESAAGGDRGVSWRNEWALQGVDAIAGKNVWGQQLSLEPYLFADGARLQTQFDGRSSALASAGAGIRFALGSGGGELILGKPIHAPQGSSKAMRVHLQFAYQF